METNIVEVENFVHHSEERRTSAFAREVNAYLERYPLTEYVDVMLTDLNGCFRGKRIPVAGLLKVEKGCYFPASVFAMDILGNVVEEAGLGQDLGEPDRRCVPVLGSLVPSATDPEYLGQLLLTMQDEDGTPFDVEPRNVLNRLWQQLRQRGLHPVVAVELEFYLIDRQRDAEGYLQPPCAPGTQDRNTQSQVYSVDNLDRFADVLSDIDELARMQQIPADGAVAEASPGQLKLTCITPITSYRRAITRWRSSASCGWWPKNTACRPPLWLNPMKSTPVAECTFISASLMIMGRMCWRSPTVTIPRCLSRRSPG